MLKMLFFAVAMATAVPAVAQTAAPATPHANHDKHSVQQAQDKHAGHAMADCCRRDAKDRMACCEGMATGNGRGCCAKQRQQGLAADPHAGHDMSGSAHVGHGSNQN